MNATFLKPLAAAAALLALSACSSIIDGTSQEIQVATNPPGADCALNREGAQIARINPTPGTVRVQKTKHDITMVCTRPGYMPATQVNKSGVAGATFGNIIMGGLIGWGIDSASGADNKYNSPVTVSLEPLPMTPAPQLPARQSAAPVPPGTPLTN